MKKKILLYNPKEKTRVRIPHVPFALLTIGSMLKEQYDVVVIDGRIDLNPEKAIEDNLSECLFFGITCMSGTPILDALKTAEYVRSINPKIPIVWGGFHPTMVSEGTIKHPLADIIVIGQGEDTVVELSEALDKGNSLEGIKGIAYKSDGKVHFNEQREIKDINEFEPIDYSMLDVNKYLKNDANGRSLDYLSSRGCPYQCGFCCISKIYNRKSYSYPVERVVNELEHLINEYKIDGIRFMDDNFFMGKQRIHDFCDKVKERKLDFKWWAMCRIDELLKFNNELWLKIKEAGLVIMNIGAESGSQKVLDKISKRITPEMILDAAKRCQEYDIEVQMSFITGFPFESEEDSEDTMSLIGKIYLLKHTIDIGLFIYSPNPGTPLFEELSKNGSIRAYTSLEEWGAKSDYYFGSTGWLTVERRKRLELVTYLVQFAFGVTLERKLKFFQRIVFKLLSADARMRWKYRFYGFPWEWMLVRFIAGANKV